MLPDFSSAGTGSRRIEGQNQFGRQLVRGPMVKVAAPIRCRAIQIESSNSNFIWAGPNRWWVRTRKQFRSGPGVKEDHNAHSLGEGFFFHFSRITFLSLFPLGKDRFVFSLMFMIKIMKKWIAFFFNHNRSIFSHWLTAPCCSAS